MTARSSPAPWGRMIFGILCMFCLVGPICLWILSARASDPAGILNLFRIWSITLALLLVWSAVYINEEPRLARGAACFAILAFAFMTLRVRSFSTRAGASPLADEPSQPSSTAQPSPSAASAAKSGNTQKIAQAPKSDKVEDAIVGKWQISDGKETTLFLKDKTFVINTDDGHTIFGRYLFLEPNRFQYFFFYGDSDTPFLWNDLTIQGDTLSRMGQEKRITYRRIETYEDNAGVTGLWISTDGAAFIIFTDGTFVFGGATVGTWTGEGGHVVARNNNTKGASWDLKVSSDGNALSGPWQSPNGEKGTATFTRPKFDKLADYIVGRWQMAGHIQTYEYKKDGTVVLTGDDGSAKTLKYSVTDENHIQPALPNVPIPLPVWTIEMVDDGLLTAKFAPKGQGSTFVRLYRERP